MFNKKTSLHIASITMARGRLFLYLEKEDSAELNLETIVISIWFFSVIFTFACSSLVLEDLLFASAVQVVSILESIVDWFDKVLHVVYLSLQ